MPPTENHMQQTRKSSFLKSLFAPRKVQTIDLKKTLQPLDERMLARVAGGNGEVTLPRSGW